LILVFEKHVARITLLATCIYFSAFLEHKFYVLKIFLIRVSVHWQANCIFW